MAFRGRGWRHTPPTSAQEADQRVQKRVQKRGRAALEAPRRTDARQLAHEQPQIEAAPFPVDPYYQRLSPRTASVRSQVKRGEYAGPFGRRLRRSSSRGARHCSSSHLADNKNPAHIHHVLLETVH